MRHEWNLVAMGLIIWACFGFALYRHLKCVANAEKACADRGGVLVRGGYNGPPVCVGRK